MITSKDNNLIKLCNQIKNKKYSREHNICLVESYKLVHQLYDKKLLKSILVTESKYDLVSKFANIRIDVIADNIASYLSDATNSDGVFAVCNIPQTSSNNFSKAIILDNIQDPANIGAIIRSAYAFGYDTIFAINSVYPYSYKTIRSSMGYIFDVNYIDITYEELFDLKQEHNITFVSADMNGENIDSFSNPAGKFAVIIGNEGQGISDKLIQASDRIVSIPMSNGVESLNASVSAGILMYLLK